MTNPLLPGEGVIFLTDAQERDLRHVVKVWHRKVGSPHLPNTVSERLRTGHYLAQKGLVELANGASLNAYRAWRPTPAGIAWVGKKGGAS